MKKTIVLTKNDVYKLQQFGAINDVVNKILDYYDENGIDIADLSTYEDDKQEQQCRVEINVDNQSYCEQAVMLPNNSPKISLKRAIKYFINNELYDELDWRIQNNYNEMKYKNVIDLILHATNFLIRANGKIGKQTTFDTNLSNKLSSVTCELDDLIRSIKNG